MLELITFPMGILQKYIRVTRKKKKKTKQKYLRVGFIVLINYLFAPYNKYFNEN